MRSLTEAARQPGPRMKPRRCHPVTAQGSVRPVEAAGRRRALQGRSGAPPAALQSLGASGVSQAGQRNSGSVSHVGQDFHRGRNNYQCHLHLRKRKHLKELVVGPARQSFSPAYLFLLGDGRVTVSVVSLNGILDFSVRKAVFEA